MGMRRLEKLMEEEVNSGLQGIRRKKSCRAKWVDNGTKNSFSVVFNEGYKFQVWKQYPVFVVSLNFLSLIFYYIIVYLFICLSLYLHSP